MPRQTVRSRTAHSHLSGSLLVLLTLAIAVAGCQAEAEPHVTPEEGPHVVASSPVEAGRYLVVVGGCNDCHTEGYLQTEGAVPEEDWLLGSVIGWRGPWGTTYPPNLRLSAQRMSEDEWVNTLHTRKAMPPMPWMNVNQMHEQDARSIYQYIKSLEVKGDPVPAYVPPDEEPSTPYLDLVPKNLPVVN